MGKTEELVNSLEEMAACSERLMKALLGVRDIIKGKRQAEAKASNAAQSEPEKTKPNEAKPEKNELKSYTFVEVRQAFSAKAHEGRTEEVRALIAKYGADKLSAVKEEDYAAIMAELETMP